MHEASIAAPLLRIVLEEFARHPQYEEGYAIQRIRLRCGILLGIEESTLRGCFSILAEGTVAEHAVLDIHFSGMEGVCRDCRERVITGKRSFACPRCGSSHVDWQGGRELVVEGITVPPRVVRSA